MSAMPFSQKFLPMMGCFTLARKEKCVKKPHTDIYFSFNMLQSTLMSKTFFCFVLFH